MAAINPGNYQSHLTEGPRVTFYCENNVAVRLEQLSPDVFKVWMSNNNFDKQQESFAVISEDFSSAENINMAETPGSFEIYTSSLIIRIRKSPLQLQVFDKWQKLIMEDDLLNGFVQKGEAVSTSKILRSNEAIYGLGEKNGSLNRRGQQFTMWNSDKPCYTTSEDPLYKSIPFFFSNYGYGILFDNTYQSTFDFGAASNDRLTFGASGGEMIYYYMFGPDYKQILQHYIQLTGKPIMPPSWALGFAQSRGLLTNEQLTRDIAKGYREREIPLDIIYQDIGWTQHLQDFEWRDGNYTDPVKMMDDLEALGIKVIVSQDPVISQNNRQQWHEADSLGFFTKDVRTGKSYDMPWPWGGNCGVVDFTNPEVADWWGAYQQKAIDAGVRGFWTDMGEPAWSNEESTDRLFQQHFLGMHDEIHNVYGLVWDKVVTEQFIKRNPDTRVFQMTRSAFAGLQRYAFGWSGDAGNGSDVNRGWGQLEAQLPLALSAGLGLIPFWSSDISGYCGDIHDYEAMGELYLRWLQFGAFNPLSRIHHEGNNAVEPWLFGAEVEQHSKAAIEMKYHLFPYLYTLASEAYETGLPIMRAMFLEFPDDPLCENLGSQFMFGPNMLVAPVLEESAVIKKVYLPKGSWIDYFHPEKIYPGKQWIDYPVTLGTIPVFVRSGSMIPTMPVMNFIDEFPAYPLVMKIFPQVGKECSFIVYEDDGLNNQYLQDHFLKRTFKVQMKNGAISITSSEVIENEFKARERDLVFQLPMDKAPASILLGNEKLKRDKKLSAFNAMKEVHDKIDKALWNWDATLGMLTVQVPAGQKHEILTIKTEK
ncbi:MAG: glycoside hydrolase family 31 protein [Prolixibacteraceae bacterium]|nr:glycoside hydrolase family 31 protein [Prolixibacteraceae bacterium]